jgi:hypothetical protein
MSSSSGFSSFGGAGGAAGLFFFNIDSQEYCYEL